MKFAVEFRNPSTGVTKFTIILEAENALEAGKLAAESVTLRGPYEVKASLFFQDSARIGFVTEHSRTLYEFRNDTYDPMLALAKANGYENIGDAIIDANKYRESITGV